LIVGFPAGGIVDLFARMIGEWLSGRLGQPFIIENRPGAGGNIGAEAVVRAPPDGHTLLLVATPNAVNATLYDKLNFDFIRDIAPVAGLDRAVDRLTELHRARWREAGGSASFATSEYVEFHRRTIKSAFPRGWSRSSKARRC